MARHHPQKEAPQPKIPLQQPNRSRPEISHQTLLDIADKRGLLKENRPAPSETEDALAKENGDPPIGRLGEAILWSMSLAMLHFTFDLLVQNQYAVNISWSTVFKSSFQAFGAFLILCYILHPHPSPAPFSPRLPPRYQAAISQLLFFVGSVASGCYLIYITNEHGYLAVMKRAPPVGCMWIWSVMELDLGWALASMVCCSMFLLQGGYSYG